MDCVPSSVGLGPPPASVRLCRTVAGGYLCSLLNTRTPNSTTDQRMLTKKKNKQNNNTS